MVLNLLIPAIASALGFGASAFGASKAADVQGQAVDKSIAAQMEMFLRGQKNIKPYLQQGKLASGMLEDRMNRWSKSTPFAGIDTMANDLFNLGSTPISFGGLDTHANELMASGTGAGDTLMGLGPTSGNALTGISMMAPEFDPINMTQAQLEATPGYQFTKQQGLKAVQNSAAARGLGISGMAQRGAADYVTGLADQTWQNVYNQLATERQARYTAGATDLERMMSGLERGYGLTASGLTGGYGLISDALTRGYGLQSAERGAQFQASAANKAAALAAITDRYNLMNTERTTGFNAWQTDLANRFNRLYQLSSLGSNAAVNAGSQAVQTGGNIGNALIGGGNASAAALMAIANAAGGFGSDVAGYSFLNQLMNQPGGAGAPGAPGAGAP